MDNFVPGYRSLLERGGHHERIRGLYELFSPCALCPRRCGALRAEGQRGVCGAGAAVRVAKALPHFGEEPPVSGARGSGTVFFSHCSLKCCFCQNYQISRHGIGRDRTIEELAGMLLGLQDSGCHNISLVSAAHYLPHAVEALFCAARRGLHLPVVYNSNGYEDVRVLHLLEGIVDIYLPDAKYADDDAALRYSSAPDYAAVNRACLDEMLRQVGHLEPDGQGIARRGLIVRHLVLPGGLAGTSQVLSMLRKNFGRHLALSLMCQYTPCFEAEKFENLSRRIMREEYEAAVLLLHELGFEQGWTQELEALDRSFVPDFTREDGWN